jgi:hypothetical protein
MDSQTNIPQQKRTLKKIQSEFNKDLKQISQKHSHCMHRLNRCVRKQYIDAFPLIECDKMCSPFKPVIKLEASVHSNIEHFFWTLTNSVHRLNRCTSKRSSVDLQRLVQEL